MSDTLICPLRYHHESGNEQCAKEKCAWWIETGREAYGKGTRWEWEYPAECAIVRLARRK
jgi:hypothetical protein